MGRRRGFGTRAGPALVGRPAAVDALRRAVDAAVTGHGHQIVLITGEGGIGKTALATATADYAKELGASVAWGTCWEGHDPPGFWPWIQIVRDLAGSPETDDVGTVFEQELGLPAALVESDLDDGAARLHVFDAVVRLLRRCTDTAPVVVVLDDLQWADVSSVRLLAFVARHVADTRLLLIGAYRDIEVEPQHPLRHLLSAVAQRGEVVPLEGLEVGAVGELVHRIVDDEVPESVAAEVHARTGGNPFFVQQVSRLLAAQPSPLEDARTGTAPHAVRDVVARRLARLPASAVDVLAAGAVIGPRFDIRTAAAVAGVHLGDAVEHVDAAVRARIVSPLDPTAVRFEHDLFRETLYEQLPVGTRSRLHEAVAEHLDAHRAAGRPVTRAEIAHHRVAALPLGDPALAVAALLAAARDATRQAAFDEAVGYYRRAIEVPGGPPVVDPAVLVEVANALRRAGRLDAARATFLTAAARARASSDPIVLARAGLGAHRVTAATDAFHGEVIAVLEGALAAVGPGPSGDRCRVLAALARELADGPARDESRALALAEEAVREARDSGDRSVLAHALWALAEVRWRPGAAREGLLVAGELIAVAEDASEPELQLEGHFSRIVALVELADPTYSSALDRFAMLADELRLPHYRYLAMSRRATRACLTGPVGSGEKLIEAAAAYGEQVGEPDAWGVKTSQLVGLAVLRGEWSRIIAAAEALGRPLVPAEFAPIVQAFHLRERGEIAAAAAVVGAIPVHERVGYRWRRIVALTMLAELAAAVGSRDRCRELYDRLTPFAGTVAVLGGAVFTTGPVSYHLGVLALALDRRDDAVAHLRSAVVLCDRLAARPYRARARGELGRALLERGRAGDRPEAVQLLVAAVSEAEELELAPVAERAAAALAELDRRCRVEQNVFRLDDGVWTLAYAGRTVRLRDAKGLHDLARLLRTPGGEIPATALLHPGGPPATGADPVLDERARTEYRARLAALDTELADADAEGDRERSARLSVERDTVVRELAHATGLGGRRRRLGDETERARTTVTARIRDSIRRIERLHPELGHHLRVSVVTGARCSYRPAEHGVWQL